MRARWVVAVCVFWLGCATRDPAVGADGGGQDQDAGDSGPEGTRIYIAQREEIRYFDLDETRRELVQRGRVSIDTPVLTAALSRDQKRLYVLGVDALQAFELDPAAFTQSPLARLPLARGGVSDLWLDPSAQWIVLGHSPVGSFEPPPPELEVLALREDGSFRGAPAIVAGSSAVDRLAADPSGRYVFGLSCARDAIAQYAFEPASGMMRSNLPDPPGTPSHDLAFHPGRRWAYATQAQGVELLRYVAATGRLEVVALGSYESEVADGCELSRLAVHPSGRFVFALTNERGGTVYTFSVSQVDGRLTRVARFQYERFRAATSLAVARSGHFLIAGGGANVFHVFQLDERTGRLTFASDVRGTELGGIIVAAMPL